MMSCKTSSDESKALIQAMANFFSKRKVNNGAIKLTEKVSKQLGETSWIHTTSDAFLTLTACSAYVYPRMPLSQVRYYHLFGA